jgi:hypothetical protein
MTQDLPSEPTNRIIIRGILKDGLRVQAGTKLVDIDPRGDPTYLSELSKKAWVIADAVLTAVRQYGVGTRKLEG